MESCDGCESDSLGSGGCGGGGGGFSTVAHTIKIMRLICRRTGFIRQQTGFIHQWTSFILRLILTVSWKNYLAVNSKSVQVNPRLWFLKPKVWANWGVVLLVADLLRWKLANSTHL